MIRSIRFSMIALLASILLAGAAATGASEESRSTGDDQFQENLQTATDDAPLWNETKPAGLWVVERYDKLKPEDPPKRYYSFVETVEWGAFTFYQFMQGPDQKSGKSHLALWLREQKILLMQIPSWRLQHKEIAWCEKVNEQFFECKTLTMPEYYLPEFFRPEIDRYYKKIVIPELEKAKGEPMDVEAVTARFNYSERIVFRKVD